MQARIVDIALRFSRCQLVVGDVPTLIDTGTLRDVPKILSALAREGLRARDLRRIILTHADGDHAGGAAELQTMSGAEVALLLVIGLHRRLVAACPLWVSAGSALGIFWVCADILQNLMHYGIFLGRTPSDLVAASARATDALWHAGHFGGGAWVLVVAATGGALFGRAYRVLSFVAGSVFMLHAFVFPVASWWFNIEFLLVPLWAFWTAAAIARSPAFTPRPNAAPSLSAILPVG